MAGNFVHTLYNLADTFFIGKLGKEAVGAPSIAFNIVMLLTVLGSSFGAAGMTLMSQSRGRGEQEKVNYYLGQTAGLTIISGFILMIVGIIFSKPLLSLLRVPPEVYDYTYTYMSICMAEIPFMFISFTFSAALQAIGDGVTPFKVQLITVVLNVILDPILIFGIGPIPAMGVAGAAIATVVSRAVSAMVALYILFSGKKEVRLSFSSMRLERKSVFLLFKIGLPSSVGQALSTLGFTVMQGAVNSFGPAVIAAFGVGNRIIGMFNMPAMGFSQATASLVGQSLGEKNIPKAKLVVRQSLITIGIFISIFMSLTFFFGAELVQFFVNDPEVMSHGFHQFRIVSISVVFFAFFNVLNGAFQGGGDTMPIMVNNILRLWGFRVPSLYLLSFVFGIGPLGIWWSMFISNMASTTIVWILYKTGRWAHKVNLDKV